MSDDDKKYTVDDILAEYNDNDPEQETEEYDNYEDGEEQDLSEKDFAQEPMFAPAGLFDSDTVSEEQDKTEDENEDIETSEELFAEEDDETVEVTEEILEEAEPETDEENIIVEAESPEDAGPEENEPEEYIAEARTWADSGIAEEITDIDIPGETEEKVISKESDEETSGDDPEEKPEEAAEEKIPEETEDVNDKWLIRFAKGIFPVKGDSVGEVIRKIIFLAALIVFIGAGIMLISTLIQSQAAQKDDDIAQSLITTTVATYIGEDGNVYTIAPTPEEIAQHNFDVAEYYKSINPDYVGYLEVEGCDIYTPVVQGRDNDEYLRKNISGGYNKAGTVFMDYRCTFAPDHESPNIVLYGHNQEDGTMFGNLKEYKQNVEFYREHPTVKLSSEFETGEYLIYGFFVTHVYEKQDSKGEVFHYHDYIETMNDEYTFNWYIKQVQRRNQIVSPVDVEFGDKLLCLSTCSNEFTDSRFVVFARKLREGESADDYDFSRAYMNPNAEGVDWEAIMSGETTPSAETDVIEDIDEDTEEVTTRAKSNNKKNSGSGSKNDGRTSVTPPAAETTAVTSVTEAEVTETVTAVTDTSETETDVSQTDESVSGAEGSESGDPDQEGPETVSGEEGSETEASDQEGEQTEAS